jgi:stage V sporulation protein S
VKATSAGDLRAALRQAQKNANAGLVDDQLSVTPGLHMTAPTADTEAENILRVSSSSKPQSVASAIAHTLYDTRRVTIRAVGASAVNQAVKAIAIASGYVAPRGMRLSCVPGFQNIESRDGIISAIVFIVDPA